MNKRENMRNKIFGGIGTLMGGAILFIWMTTNNLISGSFPHQFKQATVVIFGGLILIIGLYTLFKKTI